MKFCKCCFLYLGDRVLIDHPVVGINQESKDQVIVKTLNGKEFKVCICIKVLQLYLNITNCYLIIFINKSLFRQYYSCNSLSLLVTSLSFKSVYPI